MTGGDINTGKNQQGNSENRISTGLLFNSILIKFQKLFSKTEKEFCLKPQSLVYAFSSGKGEILCP